MRSVSFVCRKSHFLVILLVKGVFRWPEERRDHHGLASPFEGCWIEVFSWTCKLLSEIHRTLKDRYPFNRSIKGPIKGPVVAIESGTQVLFQKLKEDVSIEPILKLLYFSQRIQMHMIEHLVEWLCRIGVLSFFWKAKYWRMSKDVIVRMKKRWSPLCTVSKRRSIISWDRSS